MGNNIEKELRYVLTDAQFVTFREHSLALKAEIKMGHSLKELTVMYDNPNPEFTFYSKAVDGRLRIRTSEPAPALIFEEANMTPNVSMLTWKQRIPEHVGQALNQEREIEVAVEAVEMKNLLQVLENVLHCPRISSYERNRETFYLQGIEVASDTFPYGHVVELEIKDGTENDLYAVAEKLGLNAYKLSTYSCDDMYKLLCKTQDKLPKSDILFEDPTMPSLNEALIKEVI